MLDDVILLLSAFGPQRLFILPQASTSSQTYLFTIA